MSKYLVYVNDELYGSVDAAFFVDAEAMVNLLWPDLGEYQLYVRCGKRSDTKEV